MGPGLAAKPSFGTNLVIAAALVQVLGGLLAAALGGAQGPAGWLVQHGVPLVHVLVYGGIGIVLTRAGRGLAPTYLGGFALVTATSFAAVLYQDAATAGVVGSTLMFVLGVTRVEAFLPFFLFAFFGRFPRAAVPARLEAAIGWGTMLSAAVAAALTAMNIGAEIAVASGRPMGAAMTSLHRTSTDGVFWILVFGLTLGAIPLGLMRSRYAQRQERQRALLFLLGIGGGLAPLVLAVIGSAVSSTISNAMDDPATFFVAQLFVYTGLLSIPLTTAYAVLVEQLLDLRGALGMALRYALARGSVLALSLVPFIALLAYLVFNRDQPIGDLLGGPQTLVLAIATLLGLVAVRARTRWLAAIDRRFFRERYDATAVLATLGHHTRSATDVTDLAETVPAQINDALHVTSATLLVLEPEARRMVSPTDQTPPMEAGWTLTSLLRGSSSPLNLVGDAMGSAIARLSDEERAWIGTTGFEMLVPLFAGDGELVGSLGLGPKLSEMPFSTRDEKLLTSIASSAGLVLDRHVERQSATGSTPGRVPVSDRQPAVDAPAAQECPVCQDVYAAEITVCADCQGELAPASIPYLLGGKFRAQRRIGAGGMGVVYSAVDINLRRRVALKALPRASHERVLRMRREARAMAAVSHPHLASLFGLEPWRTGWVLIMEFVAGGTLAERLRTGPMAAAEVVAMGKVLADALVCLHDEGILHRDVKPSNIGVTGNGTHKLMDFGVVRILSGEPSDDVVTLDPADPLAAPDDPLTTSTGAVVGSPLYLSPEAARGDRATPQVDLWSLALVLYEAVAGRNPMRRETVAATLSAIADARVPSLGTLVADPDAALTGFFAAALARRPRDRFPTAAEFRAALEELS
jgi:hypothetical protein